MARLALTMVLVDVLLLSAAAKLLRPREFLEDVRSYQALGSLPATAVVGASVLVPVVELLSAALLAIPRFTEWGAIAALVSFAGFSLLIVRDERTYITNCGCWRRFGINVPKRAHLARNALLAAASFLLIVAGALSGHPRWSGASRIALPVITLPFALIMLELPQIARVAVGKEAVAP